MKTPSLRTVVVALAVATLVAAGCGDDDDDATVADSGSDPTDQAAADSGDSGAYCDASLAIETAPEPEIDYPTATPDEIAAGLQTWAEGTMQPLIDDVVAVTPDEINGDVEVMTDAFEQVAAGNPSAFDVPEVVAAEAAIHQYDLGTCGWTSHEVSAKDYEFVDLPTELSAGVTSFEFSNEGTEVHELMLAKKNDGVTDSAADLLALPEDEAMTKITIIGSPAFALPGESDYKVADLEPGDYVAVCFIPTGMTSDDGPPPEGAPHFTHGMVAELTVT